MAGKLLPLLEFSSAKHPVFPMFVFPKLSVLELPMVLEFSTVTVTMTIMSNTMGVMMTSAMGHVMSSICRCCSCSTSGEHSCYTVP